MAVPILLCFLFCVHLTVGQIDPQATPATVALRDTLKRLMDTPNWIFGQEMPVTYKYKSGFTNSDLTRSDVKDVVGDNPGLYGADFHYIFYKTQTEADAQKAACVEANKAGSIVSFNWHMYSRNSQTFNNDGSNTNLVRNIVNPSDTTGDRTWFLGQMDQIAAIFKSFNFPVLYRPFHEMNGNWFWWGNQDPQDFIKLYQLTVTSLQSRGVHNILYVWSPNQGAKFWDYYPGNGYVDIIGFDGYEPGLVDYFTWNDFISLCESIVDYSITNDKIPAITEIGSRNDKSIESVNNFWTSVLNQIKGSAKASKLTYLQTWINGGWEKPYTPYSGMPQTGAITDFQTFYGSSNTLFQQDVAAFRANQPPLAPRAPVPIAPNPVPVPVPQAAPVPSSGCTNIPPDSQYTCAQQAGWGKCDETWMQGKCDADCGRCGGYCTDIAPDAQYTCAQQAGWGKCGETWMQGKCNRSCGRCTGAPIPQTPSVPDMTAPQSSSPSPVPLRPASPPSPVVPGSPVPIDSPVAPPTNNSESEGVGAGVIAGACVGGVVGVAAIAGVTWYLLMASSTPEAV